MARRLRAAPSSSRDEPAETRKVDVGELPRMSRKIALQCAACGRTARYDVGTLMISPQAFEDRRGKQMPEEFVGFTGYVRCRHCDAGGPWHFPNMTMMQMMAMLVLKTSSHDDTPIEFGEMRTFDGFTVRYASECVEHIKQLIEREPTRAFLWTRLGNAYRNGGVPNLAESAYRRALELDPADFEAHGSLAQIYETAGNSREALHHWQSVLALARSATQTSRELRHGLVRAAIEAILEEQSSSGKRISFYPPDYDPTGDHSREEPLILEIRELDLSKERDLESLCDGFLGEPRKSLKNRIANRLEPVKGTNERIPAESSKQIVGRNAPCPCGSGRKYKKCCGRAER